MASSRRRTSGQSTRQRLERSWHHAPCIPSHSADDGDEGGGEGGGEGSGEGGGGDGEDSSGARVRAAARGSAGYIVAEQRTLIDSPS